jgi:hypothetical protein
MRLPLREREFELLLRALALEDPRVIAIRRKAAAALISCKLIGIPSLAKVIRWEQRGRRAGDALPGDWLALSRGPVRRGLFRQGRPPAASDTVPSILKHRHNLSDKDLCAHWIEKPYCQLFCYEEFFASCASSTVLPAGRQTCADRPSALRACQTVQARQSGAEDDPHLSRPGHP